MVRRRRFGSSRRGPKRKVSWAWGALTTPGITYTGDHSWTSNWLVWPASYFDPQLEAVPAPDQTLVKSIINYNVLYNTDVLDFVTAPVQFTIGLLAFEGGHEPISFDGAQWVPGNQGAPPSPTMDAATADWIIRCPMIFQAGNSYQGPALNQFAMSSAMRKLETGMGILCVAEYADFNGIVGSSVFSWGLDARFALKSGSAV